MALKFNPETHEYRLDGKLIPGVTAVLGAVGIIETAWFREEAAWRGSVVHKCCELDDLGTIAQYEIDPKAEPYLDAYRAFKRDKAFRPLLIEQPLADLELGYAGTPDRTGLIVARQRGCDYEVTLDLKTGAGAWWHRLQLAAYSELTGTKGRIVLRLKPDGTYNAKELPIADRWSDKNDFMRCLYVYHLKEQVKEQGK